MKSRLKTAIAAATALGLATISYVGVKEGYSAKAYRDIVGVWTICYGETKGVKPGMVKSRAECDQIFLESLVRHEQGMRKCLKAPDAIPDKPYLAFVSFTYNLGVGAFCKSTMAKKINAGDLRGACNELPKWNRAGGRPVKGLTLRRADEQRLCLEGVK